MKYIRKEISKGVKPIADQDFQITGDIDITGNYLQNGSPFSSFDATASNTFTASQKVDVTDNANPAFKITQKGTGDALLVEDDAADPDTTPFVVKADGKVGIGKTNPSYALDVNGTINVTQLYVNGSALSTASSIPIKDTTGTTQFTSTNSTGLRIAGSGTTTVSFQPASNQVTIDSNTSVPIKDSGGVDQFTSTNSTGLRIAGSGATTVSFQAASNQVTIDSPDGIPVLNNAGVTQFTPTNSQGISFEGTGATTVSFDATSKRVTINSSGASYSVADAATLGLVQIGYGENGKNYPVELNNNKMFVNVPWTDTDTTYVSGRGITIGHTSTVTNATNALNLTEDMRSMTGGVLGSVGTMKLGYDDSNYLHMTPNQWHFYFGLWSASEKARLTSGGDFHADGDIIAYSTTISDIRLKENITKIENPLAKIKQLNGVTFLRKDTNKPAAGLIAQDVEKVLPEAVRNKKLPIKFPNSDIEYKTLEYDAVIGLLVESIKELKHELDVLKKWQFR